MEDFDKYWHIGQAQILSGKVTEADFKANIKEYVIKARIEELKKFTAFHPIGQRIAQLKKELNDLPSTT